MVTYKATHDKRAVWTIVSLRYFSYRFTNVVSFVSLQKSQRWFFLTMALKRRAWLISFKELSSGLQILPLDLTSYSSPIGNKRNTRKYWKVFLVVVLFVAILMFLESIGEIVLLFLQGGKVPKG